MIIPDEYERLTNKIIGAAMRVHSQLGPGLLESAYEACLEFELRDQGFVVERQKPLPLVYREVRLECGYRLDLLVEGKIVVEVKAIETLETIHSAQLLSYLKLSGCHVGLLVNFNVQQLKSGIRRILHDI
ncbi:MAG TPA: GxxExxY protein [Ktedonobacterales bacterium]|nr:GxxExxY protein [Ktedonobacterales bacterium]